MSFRTALGLVELPWGARLAAAETRSASIAKSLIERFGIGASVPDPVSINEIASEVIGALQERRLPRPRAWRKAPWCLWTSDPAIADYPEALDHFFESSRDKEKCSRSFLRALATVYLRDFSIERPSISAVRDVILARIDDLPQSLAKLISVSENLHPLMGPSAFAKYALDRSKSIVGEMRELGLGPAIAEGGFANVACSGGLRLLSEKLRDEATTEVVTSISRIVERPGGGDAFPTLVGRMLSALISPFADAAPPTAVRDQIIEIALDRFGDPRLQRHHWIRNRSEADVLSRWLDEESLRQFLDVVDETALRDHWDYRRAFWEAWWRRGYVEQAWVAFGPDGFRRAKRLLGERIRFARLLRGGPGSDYLYDSHSVLLLRIGDLTVADWSHNSKCYIWKPENPRAPQFYQERYMSGSLRDGSDFSQSHNSPATYSWQHDVNEFIRKQTGLVLTLSDYRVD